MRLLQRDQWLRGCTPRLRGALIVGCALALLSAVTTATPAISAKADAAVALHAAPWASAAAEARVLADRILRRESDDLLLDGGRQRALGSEIKRVLSLIRRSYPAMAGVPVWEDYRPATLVLGLEGALRDTVVGTWPEESAFAPPPTGQAAFDALNARLGLRAVRTYRYLDSVALSVDERVNIVPAILAYLMIEGVAYAEPDLAWGDGPDIEAIKVDGTWHVVFRKAWGDCPSGCIFEELSFFTVADGEVVRIEPDQARTMDSFATLLANAGWR